MEEKTIYYISEAAKKVQVENHVLRYWEEELQLPIKRNEMGHRYYTEQDVKQLQEIKLLKEQGLQLKAIRTVLFKMPAISDGDKRNLSEQEAEKTVEIKADQLRSEALSEMPNNTSDNMLNNMSDKAGCKEYVALENRTEMQRDKLMDMVKERVDEKTEEVSANKAHKYVVALSGDKSKATGVEQKSDYDDAEKSQKSARLQYLLQQMITEAVRSANRELCMEVKDSILKELDYQFRMQEERDDERWKIEEEHYRKIDEMIRERHKPKEKLGKGKKRL
ncbi:MAG: helix-turn-helix domain-containing protein [Lachnospiraceae bacterium]|nr:helix-turn-helix domain-containing protein [Lachnospiraceae bacterium]